MISNITFKLTPWTNKRLDSLESYYAMTKPILELTQLLFVIVRDSSNTEYWQSVDGKLEQALFDRLGILEKANHFKNDLWCDENRFGVISEFMERFSPSPEFFTDHYACDHDHLLQTTFLNVSTQKTSPFDGHELSFGMQSNADSIMAVNRQSTYDEFEAERKKLIGKLRYRERVR